MMQKLLQSSKTLLSKQQTYAFSSQQSQQQKRKVVLLPGHGIGPEISNSVKRIFEVLKVPIEWEEHHTLDKPKDDEGNLIDNKTLEKIKEYKYALKGPLMTPIGEGYRSLNVTLRKKLQLYANVRPCKSFEGVKTHYDNVDVVTMRENTEGEYSGIEHKILPGVVENLKIISQKASYNICKYAYEFAKANGRKKVSVCLKAGVMKQGDGLFMREALKVAEEYPEIQTEVVNVDTVCFQLASNPQSLDVMVMPNLYGDIVSDLCSGLIGGLGLTASGNIGSDCELYEAVHGTAPDIAGKDLANPTALLLSSTMMLNSMGFRNEAANIDQAVKSVLKENKYVTGDLGGKYGNTDYTNAIIDRLQ
ncbi:hypothetical protein PPERSA_09455 [Pseudocohnilembus persalinus]|uniref:Isopropylmalate dehydrogenase-like domain-containing protein n=1 Tax=Pseudocohnilembus persalinus TaxID=266149 RepID=A0A0V0Q9Q3_PSEPJ|nr:hypothetical protein PPERSA_09455 [Pseudocohnilembus persalinus]|eukprot:KRW98930.1 hypothetical protein PPERSA_09455 [Pseudocohnilembus persalinus]